MSLFCGELEAFITQCFEVTASTIYLTLQHWREVSRSMGMTASEASTEQLAQRVVYRRATCLKVAAIRTSFSELRQSMLSSRLFNANPIVTKRSGH